VEELRNKTMGVVGYGDIGQAAARIARVFGMKIIALRRNPQLSEREMLEHLTVSSVLACSASRGDLLHNVNLASVWLLACWCQCLLHWLTPPTLEHTSASHSL
jgi:D-arabinose 1-dehydrogenase-like Zn-dependent alcohol dehydrogenase